MQATDEDAYALVSDFGSAVGDWSEGAASVSDDVSVESFISSTIYVGFDIDASIDTTEVRARASLELYV